MPNPNELPDKDAAYLEDLNLDSSIEDLENPLDPANFGDDDGDNSDDSNKTGDQGKELDDSDENGDSSDDDDDADEPDYKKLYEEQKARAEKVKGKLKKGYQKHGKDKAQYMTKEEVEQMQLDLQKKIETQREEEFSLLEKFPTAKKDIGKMRQIANEKGLTLEEAHLIVNKTKFLDPAYANGRNSGRTGLNGQFSRKEAETVADKILSEKPRFMRSPTN